MSFVKRYRLGLVLAVALVLRLGVLLAFPGVFNFEDTGAIHGSAAYDEYATNLLETGVYGRAPGQPDARTPPGYSYVLAAVYALAGRGGVQVGVFHTLLDLLTITCLYYIGRALFGQEDPERGAWVGAGAGLFYAGYPYLIFQNLTLIDTPLFMTLLYAFLLLMIHLRQRPQTDAIGWGLAVAGGLVLGLAVLVRPIIPVIAVMVSVWFLFRRGVWASVARLLPVALISLTMLAGWSWRNYGVYETFVPLSLTTGTNFYQGNNRAVVPYFRAGYDVQWTAPDNQANDPYSPAGDAERMALAVDFWQQNPGHIPELMWVKFLVHWSIDIAPRRNPTEGNLPRLEYNGDVWEIAEGDDLALSGLPEGDPVAAYSEPLFDRLGRTLHRYYYGALFFLCLGGMALTWREWREVSLLWLVQFGMTFVYVLTHPSTRYRAPTDPLLFLFSAALLWWLYWQISPRIKAPSN